MRGSHWVIPAIVCTCLLAGCKKSGSEAADQGTNKAPASVRKAVPETVARIHWAGLKALQAQTNAATLKKVLALPETAKLTTQTLDKLSLGLVNGYSQITTNFALWVTNYSVLLSTNQPAALVRPLLDDLVQEETFIELRRVTNQPGELVLAVRVEEGRAGVWGTNLASAIEALTGTRPAVAQSNGLNWECVLPNSPWKFAPGPQHVQLLRAGNWTLLGLAPEKNDLLKELSGRIGAGQGGTPVSGESSNYWLEASLDPAGITSALGLNWGLPQDFPKIWLAETGQGDDVLTRARVTFAHPLPDELPAWNIPTNLINEPLHGFTAIRGFGPWLSSRSWWKDLQAGDAPNQVFTWAQSGTPFLDYLAAPMPNASNAVEKIGDRVMQIGNPILTSNRMGLLERSTNFHGITWSRIPLMAPFIKEQVSETGSFLFAGVSPHTLTNSTAPEGTFKDLFGRTNVVYYDREITGPRIEAWMYLSQLSRIVFRRYQVPGEAATVGWLRSTGPLLGPTLTVGTRSGPAEISLERVSPVGATGMEFHVFADWLESPSFPVGLYTLMAKLPPPRPRGPSTNALDIIPK